MVTGTVFYPETTLATTTTPTHTWLQPNSISGLKFYFQWISG